MTTFVLFDQRQNDVFDFLRIVDFFKIETFTRSGGLQKYIPIAEKGCPEPTRFGGYILDLIEV